MNSSKVLLLITLFSLVFVPLSFSQEKGECDSSGNAMIQGVKVIKLQDGKELKLGKVLREIKEVQEGCTGSCGGGDACQSCELKVGPKEKAFLGVYLNDSGNGVSISGVEEGSPAEKGGLKPEDLLLKVNEIKIGSVPDLQKAMASFSPGDSLVVTVKRGDDEIELKVEAGKAENMDLSEALIDEDEEGEGRIITIRPEVEGHKGILSLIPQIKKLSGGEAQVWLQKIEEDEDVTIAHPGAKGETKKRRFSIDMTDFLKGQAKGEHHEVVKSFAFPGGSGTVNIRILGNDGNDGKCHMELELDESGVHEVRGEHVIKDPHGNVMILKKGAAPCEEDVDHECVISCDECEICCGEGQPQVFRAGDNKIIVLSKGSNSGPGTSRSYAKKIVAVRM